MTWSVFIVITYLFLAAQQGLAPAIAFSTDFGPVIPRFELILLSLVALFAPSRLTILVWAAMGLTVDLLAVYAKTSGADGTLIIGPNTLGYLAGAYVAMQARFMVLRTHPVSLCFTSVLGGAAMSLIAVAIFTIRQWYDPLPGYSGTADLATRALGLLYTAVIALFLAVPLLKLAPLMGLPANRLKR